jgi:hypothetical protein
MDSSTSMAQHRVAIFTGRRREVIASTVRLKIHRQSELNHQGPDPLLDQTPLDPTQISASAQHMNSQASRTPLRVRTLRESEKALSLNPIMCTATLAPRNAKSITLH